MMLFMIFDIDVGRYVLLCEIYIETMYEWISDVSLAG